MKRLLFLILIGVVLFFSRDIMAIRIPSWMMSIPKLLFGLFLILIVAGFVYGAFLIFHELFVSSLATRRMQKEHKEKMAKEKERERYLKAERKRYEKMTPEEKYSYLLTWDVSPEFVYRRMKDLVGVVDGAKEKAIEELVAWADEISYNDRAYLAQIYVKELENIAAELRKLGAHEYTEKIYKAIRWYQPAIEKEKVKAAKRHEERLREEEEASKAEAILAEREAEEAAEEERWWANNPDMAKYRPDSDSSGVSGNAFGVVSESQRMTLSDLPYTLWSGSDEYHAYGNSSGFREYYCSKTGTTIRIGRIYNTNRGDSIIHTDAGTFRAG